MNFENTYISDEQGLFASQIEDSLKNHNQCLSFQSLSSVFLYSKDKIHFIFPLTYGLPFT